MAKSLKKPTRFNHQDLIRAPHIVWPHLYSCHSQLEALTWHKAKQIQAMTKQEMRAHNVKTYKIATYTHNITSQKAVKTGGTENMISMPSLRPTHPVYESKQPPFGSVLVLWVWVHCVPFLLEIMKVSWNFTRKRSSFQNDFEAKVIKK